MGLAVAAFVILPFLEFSGFTLGRTNTPQALATLNIAYAAVPSILKLFAFGYLSTLPSED